MKDIYITTKGLQIKLLKLQLGFVCPMCNAMIPVRDIFQSFCICPGCSWKQELKGKYSIQKLLYLGNPALNAIDAGIFGKKETSGFHHIKLNISPYKPNCPKCSRKMNLDQILENNLMECANCKTNYKIQKATNEEKKSIHPLLLQTMTIDPFPLQAKENVLKISCSNCGAPLDISDLHKNTGKVQCKFCETYHILEKYKVPASEFERPPILIFLNVAK